MSLDNIGKKIEQNILNENIDKYKRYVKKVVVLTSGIEGVDRTKSKIYVKKLKINQKQEIIIFAVDLNNNGNINKLYDINGNLIYSDRLLDWIKGEETLTNRKFIEVTLASFIGWKARIERISEGDERLTKIVFSDLSTPEVFNNIFSDKYITLLDFVKIQKAFDKLGLDIKGKLKENIKKICKLEKEKYGTNEVCNKYKDLYDKTWKEKLEEFPDIIKKGTKQITTLGQQMYTYYYQEKELKYIKGYVDEETYNKFMEILKERDIRLAKNAIELMKRGELDFDGVKINLGNFFDRGEIRYEYIGNDEIKVSNGKNYFAINPLEKIVKIKNKEIDFYVDNDKLYKIEDVDKYVEEKKKKALEYARKYIDLINKGYIIFYKERGLLKDFWKKDLKIEYIKNDNVRISDGNEIIIMNTNTGKKYIIYKGRKVDFGLNPEKIEDALKFDLDKYNP